MLINIEHIYKYFNGEPLLKDISFTLNEGETVGLVGRNGSGKSTLLKMILGEEEYDKSPTGEGVFTVKDCAIGFLAQNSGLNSSATVIEEMNSAFSRLFKIKEKMDKLAEDMTKCVGDELEFASAEYSSLSAYFEAHDGYNTDFKIKLILNGMGFSDLAYDRVVSSLSGGEKTRLALAKLLLEQPELLILDEPTNHLDFKTLMWLEGYLKTYRGAIIIVSHDRYFVKKVATQLLVFEDGTTNLYQFGYEQYQEKLDKEALESKNVYRGNAIFGGAISQNGSSQTGSDANRSTSQTAAAGNVGESTNANSAAQAGGMAVSSTGKAYYNPGKERSKVQKKVKKAEEDLAVKEAKLDELKAELMKPEYQSSYSKLTEIQNEIDALEEEILIDMEAWEELSSQLEALG